MLLLIACLTDLQSTGRPPIDEYDPTEADTDTDTDSDSDSDSDSDADADSDADTDTLPCDKATTWEFQDTESVAVANWYSGAFDWDWQMWFLQELLDQTYCPYGYKLDAVTYVYDTGTGCTDARGNYWTGEATFHDTTEGFLVEYNNLHVSGYTTNDFNQFDLDYTINGSMEFQDLGNSTLVMEMDLAEWRQVELDGVPSMRSERQLIIEYRHNNDALVSYGWDGHAQILGDDYGYTGAFCFAGELLPAPACDTEDEGQASFAGLQQAQLINDGTTNCNSCFPVIIDGQAIDDWCQ